MAAKLLVSQRNLLPCLSHSKSSKSRTSSSSSSSTLLTTTTHGRQSRIGWNGVGVGVGVGVGAPISTGPKRLKVSPVDVGVGVGVEEASSALLTTSLSSPSSSLFLLADSAGYSLASYYTSLGLFVISVPGLWSLIKRSVKSKIVQKTYTGKEEDNKEPNRMAGQILSFFTRNNFVVSDRGETIIFEGEMVPSRGQAALLTFCTCISLASVALVLTITFPDLGNNWFWLTVFSPLAGIYYWKRASRKEQIKVKMIVAEDGTLSEIIVQGDDQQVEQMRKELQLSEKGMVYVKGIFER